MVAWGEPDASGEASATEDEAVEPTSPGVVAMQTPSSGEAPVQAEPTWHGEASANRREERGERSPEHPSFPVVRKYELLEEIGHGGMATVYRAWDPRLERSVAVKIIHRHLRENTEVAGRFLAEARASARLKHPNVVQVFDVADDEEPERYLVAELVRGETLRSVLKAMAPLPAEIAAAIVHQLCLGLAHAHEQGIVHRDVKPENVLLEVRERVATSEDAAVASGESMAPGSRRGPPSRTTNAEIRIKLTDFGIAKMMDAHGMTMTGQVLGSPSHMAPEQIDGSEISARTDVFGLGVIFYECCVGHLPFEGTNPAQILRRVLEGKFEAAVSERPEVGEAWSRMISSALLRDPSMRTASPNLLATQIEEEFAALELGNCAGWIEFMLRDAVGCRKALTEHLVPILLRQGEQAFSRGERSVAAGALNRAQALDPDNREVMTRYAELTRLSRRRARLRRALLPAISVALLIALGLSWRVSSRWRDQVEIGREPAAMPLEGDVETAARAAGKPRDPSGAEVTPKLEALNGRDPRERVGTQAAVASREPALKEQQDRTLSTGTNGLRRKVQFSVLPSGAQLELDGAPFPWFGRTEELTVGQHRIRAQVPGSNCCETLIESVQVEPATDPRQVQRVVLRLPLRPAVVTVVNGPTNGYVECPDLFLRGFVGASRTVRLADAVWKGNCEFTDAQGRRQARGVEIRAGESNNLEWPAKPL